MKIAILSLSTFGYFERLAGHATARGVPAEFFDERPANDVATKLLFRFAPGAVAERVGRRHLDGIIDRILAGGFTHVLVTLAEIVSETQIRRLRDAGLRVFRFTWDSVENRPRVRRLDHLMEAVGSFDPQDCARFGYAYIPLYSEVVAPAEVPAAGARDVDFYFCGTMHSDRPAIMHDALESAAARGWRTEFILFYHSRRLYALRNWTSRRAMALRGRITDVPVPHAATIADSRRARVVVDIHHPRQRGLTMRSFEAIAQGAVLLTTNAAALDLMEPGLRGRVALLDKADVAGSMAAALEREPGPLAPDQYHALSLDRFMDDVFALMEITREAGTAPRPAQAEATA